MSKQQLIQQINANLAAELAHLTVAIRNAREGATHAESKPENQYDTRALEASYLAGAQEARANELRGMINALESIASAGLEPRAAIGPAALVELECDGERSWVFLLAQGAGQSLALDGRPVQAVTPLSPLGRALAGRQVGDLVTLRTGKGEKEYEVISLA